MKLVTLHENKNRRLVFYLAMEEYLSSIAVEDYLFLWQVSPTVIIGRNQVVSNEVNVEYCKSNCIQIFRRKSGGGCVYADEGNLMISYITPNKDTDYVFTIFLDRISRVLESLGFDAVRTNNNDILIEGKKVSGNAFYRKPTGSIVHGTLLYDVDICEMRKAITPPREKMQKHGIQSVRQRVINLRSLGLLNIDIIKKQITNQLCDDVIELNIEQVREIEKIEDTYLDKAFIFNP